MEISIIEGELGRLMRLYPDLGSLLTWGALILAAIVAVTTLFRTTAIVVLRRRKSRTTLIPHTSFHYYDDESCSSSSDDEDDEQEEEEEEDMQSDNEDEISTFSTDSEADWEKIGSRSDEVGNFWPEIGGAVVKAWDGLGLGGSGSNSNLISLLDHYRSETAPPRSFLAGKGEIPLVNLARPGLIVSTFGNDSVVKVWDARSDGEVPVLRRRITGGETGKVMAVDLRSSKASTWWDDEEGIAGVGGENSVASWCRNAAKCLTLLPLTE